MSAFALEVGSAAPNFTLGGLGAKNTPHMYVINKNGTLVYQGGMVVQ
jgi:hypothetical protein